MKAAIIQSNYLPWRGYFDIIDDVDIFIFHDDLQYTKSDWRNRNKIKTDRGSVWLTVPVHYTHTYQLICETHIDYLQKWNVKHIHQFRQWYGKAKFFSLYHEEFFEILTHPFQTLTELNIQLAQWVMSKLEIKTLTRLSPEFSPQGKKTDRLIDILLKAGATTYISGPTGRNYLDPNQFSENKIRLEYKTYDYPPYPQLWGCFIGNVTIIDLLFNVGPDARKYLKSLNPNEVAVKV